MNFLELLTKHAALAAQAAAGTLDDAGRAELAKYTAAAEALQGKRALPSGLEVRVLDAAGFQAHVEAELAKGLDPDRLAVLKHAMDAVAAYQAAGADRFAVQCLKDELPAAGPALDPTALAAMVEAAVAKAFDARFKAGVGTPAVVATPDAAVATEATPAAKDEPAAPEPTPEPAPPVETEPTPAPVPDPAPEADPVAKGAEAGWFAGDWAAMVATEGQAAE